MSMNGNPHYEEAKKAQTASGAQTHATLALAYEQQTANLIAFLDGASAPLPPGDGPAELYASIVARLGLKGDTK